MSQRSVLIIIVFSQFACTSLWFAGNAVINDLFASYNLTYGSLGYLTSAVQFGFIIGTLLFAIFTISDRYSPSNVFFICALLGALFNISIFFLPQHFYSLLAARFLTGFMLAGIYPVGMKIASDYHQKGLGKALGWLVGALVLGTAAPHLIKSTIGGFNWQIVIAVTSGLSILGGLLIILLVPDGPYRAKSPVFDVRAISRVFQNKPFRAAAYGYFGHMWELYAFWTFVPVILSQYQQTHDTNLAVPIWSFLIIAAGFPGCVLGGEWSIKKGSGLVAFSSLLVSGCCILTFPLIFDLSKPVLMVTLIIWGTTVVADSPQFSTLVASTAPKQYIGTALTIVNCIGFFITIFSIQLLSWIIPFLDFRLVFFILLLGPIFGLYHMRHHLS